MAVRNSIGAAIGFAGLVLFMNPGLVDWGDPRILAGNALLILAAILWALGSCLYRRREFPLAVLGADLLAARGEPAAGRGDRASCRVPGAIQWSPGLVAIVLYNCVVTTALGYFFWGKVLSMMPAAMAGQVLTLTPIGGFVLSLMMFGGTLSLDVVVSIA